MSKKIYLSGKITGKTYEEALSDFSQAENKVNSANLVSPNSVQAINPMTIEHNHDQSWNSFMKVDLKALLDCDAIYMLKGWHESKGANIEYNLAKSLDLEIFFEQ